MFNKSRYKAIKTQYKTQYINILYIKKQSNKHYTTFLLLFQPIRNYQKDNKKTIIGNNMTTQE